jgi:hypothetical protein
MKVIAAIEADTDQSPLGTASRLGDDLAGCAVLRRTVQRVQRCHRLASVHVITRPDQQHRVAGLLNGLDASIETHAHGPPPWQDRVRRARKWSLASWRGGIGGLHAFDESIHAGVLAALGQREQADAIASIHAAAPLIDPDLLDAMVEHLGSIGEDYRVVFCQAPPGLSALLARPAFLDDLYRAGQPPGLAFAYLPDKPQLDFTSRPCCYGVPNTVVQTTTRALADTDRGMALLAELLDNENEDSLTAEQTCILIADRRRDHVDRLPNEVELELTTDDQLSETVLRPRGSHVPTRGPIPVHLVSRIAEELAQYDDSLLVLGGFGEPLMHPTLPEILAACRKAGIFGLAVRTNGLAMQDGMIDLLIEHNVDVVNVTIDAHSPETYRTLHNTDAFDRVVANIEALRDRIIERRCGGPLIVPEMAKLRITLPEQEAFFDDWIRRVGWANVVSPSHYAGHLPDQSVMKMAPPQRMRCGRLWSRLMILADGTAVTCDQDVAARQPVGQIAAEAIEAIWTGPTLDAIRSAHQADELADLPLCPACDEWHRP